MTGVVDYTDVDDVVVHRLMEGIPPGGPISAADTAEVVRRLAARQFSDGQIAYVLGMTRRTVLRHRARHRIPAGVRRFSNSLALPVSAPTRPRARG